MGQHQSKMGQHSSSFGNNGVGAGGGMSGTPSHGGQPNAENHDGRDIADRADNENNARVLPNRPVNGTGMDFQSQSVRAAIDSFIETCLQTGADDRTSPPAPPVRDKREQQNEVINVENDEEGTRSQQKLDAVINNDSAKSSANRTASRTNSESSMIDKESDKLDKLDVSDNKPSSPTESVRESKDGNKTFGQELGARQVVDQRHVPSSAQQSSEKDFNKSALSDSSKPWPGYGEDVMKKIVIFDSKDLGTDSPNESDGLKSVPLKTIIDRVLDNSLGVGVDVLNSFQPESQILAKIAADEKEQMDRARTKQENARDGDGSDSKKPGDKSDRKMEPMAVCFMDHITKAVERSFSSITEEEERKEKEKVLAARAAESKNLGNFKSVEQSTSGDLFSADGTVSVQDIVDRVISQTGVLSRLAPATSAMESRIETKPLLSVSGTFFPDRAATASSIHHQQRRERDGQKDDGSRESNAGPARRGRPRMRSPYLDHREQTTHDHQNTGRRGSVGAMSGQVHGSQEDYLQSMQAHMVKFGPHTVQSFQPGMVANAQSGTAQGYHPPSVTHHNSVGLHRGTSGLHQVRAGQPPYQSQATGGSQPPPLLRVNPADRVERPPHQKAAPHHHAPNRNCNCTACAVFFTHDREMTRIMQQQQQQQQQQHPGAGDRNPPPHMPPNSSHHAYSKGQAAPQRWAGVDPLRPGQDQLRPETKTEKVSPYPYLGEPFHGAHAHPVYGIQTGVPVPHMAYGGDKAAEARHEAHYSKQAIDRADYSRHAPYDKTATMTPDAARRSYPPATKPASSPAPLLHPTATKPDDPVLDLRRIRRDHPSHSAFTLSAAPSTDEEKPLDLSAKKSAGPSPSVYSDRQRDSSDRQREGQRYGAAYPETSGHSREGERYPSGSQHLHNLESNMENYLPKYPHGVVRAAPPLNISAGVPPQSNATLSSSGLLGGSSAPLHNISSGLPPHSSMGLPRPAAQAPPHSGSSVPLPPHPSSQQRQQSSYLTTPSTHPGSTYLNDPLLSPGGRRPQLHPIPAPNLSTTLGPSPRPTFHGRNNSSGDGAVERPTVSSASTGPTLTVSALPPNNPSPLGQGPATTHNRPFSADFLRPSSGSVSPPTSSHSEGDGMRRGSVSRHEPFHNILGSNNPHDVLYLICVICRQTYGSPYGFRKHFRNQHGFEPQAEHCLVQTISQAREIEKQSRGDGENERFSTPQEFGGGGKEGGRIPSPRSDLGQSAAADESPRSLNLELTSEGGGESQQRRDSRASDGHESSRSCTPLGEKKEIKPDRLECFRCDQSFPLNNYNSYKRHSKQHCQQLPVDGAFLQAGTSQMYSCVECQVVFPEAHMLQDHMLRHQNHSVICSVCRQTFPSYPACQEHMATAHVTAEPTSSSSSSSVSFDKPKTSLSAIVTQLDITSTTARSKVINSSSADSSCPIGFNLQVTTPSDLEIRRLPADHIVTSASPDSSSDNKKSSDSNPVSSSDKDPIKQEPEPEIPSDTAKPSSDTFKPSSDSFKPSLDNLKPFSDSFKPSSDFFKLSSNSFKPSSDNFKPFSDNFKPSIDSFKPSSDTFKPSIDSFKLSSDSFKPAITDGKDSPQIKMQVKTKPEEMEEKDNGVDSHSISTGGSSPTVMEAEESTDLYLYKHKKFSAHRKRVGSNEGPEPKQSRLDLDSNSQGATSCASDKIVLPASDKISNKKVVDSPKSVVDSPKSVTGADAKSTLSTGKAIKTEARHQMPFVWDRVTRSQVSKSSRASDYS